MKYDLKNTSIEDLLNEVEQMEQSGDHDRARMASISIHILKRTGNRVSVLLDARDAEEERNHNSEILGVPRNGGKTSRKPCPFCGCDEHNHSCI